MSLQPGLAGLEKELGCSICTELLYQPLTLLDCLHTFCGSCVKEWFYAQGSRRHSSSAPRFTCPSCRAEVRDTRPNATVTTLLDMVLAAQPDRARSDAEKKEIAERYKPGDPVFPPLPAHEETSEDEADTRLMNEVRDLSLRESRGQARRDGRRNPSRHADDSQRRSEGSERQQRPARHNDSEHSRRIEHQSSLRSLLSLSSETETMEEEILRQIMEEGLLDDVDLENLGPRQEEELSERIADAYRRRHMQQTHARPEQRRRRSPGGTPNPHPRSQSARRSDEVNSTARESREGNDRRPPVSRPHLLGSGPSPRPTRGHQRRNSEQTNGRRTSPVGVNPASNSDDTLRPAVRSASDMTAERPRSSQPERSRADSAHRPRRATESDQNISNIWMAGGDETVALLETLPVTLPVPFRESPRLDRPHPLLFPLGLNDAQDHPQDPVLITRSRRYPATGCLQWSGFGPSAETMFELIIASSNGRPAHITDPGHLLSSFKYQRPPENAHVIASGERRTNSNPSRRLESGLFCDICQSSTNECYWKCNQCNEGDWGFCNRCVNQGRCCTHPLLPVRRIAGAPPSSPSGAATAILSAPEKDSYKILSFSTNCDICTYPIPASVTRFHCLQCNDGDYDVCTNCYLKLVANSKISKENGHSGWRRCIAGHRMIIVGFEDHVEGQRRVIVRNLVGGHALKDEHVNRSPASSPAVGGPITSPDTAVAHWSWKEGQGQERRKKASRLRGPLGLSNGSSPHLPDHSSPNSPVAPTPPALRRFPPDGGVGLIVRAKWSFFPEDEVQDELPFPRGADITEVDIINDEWFWGCYAARTGLFYGKYVEIIRNIE
ncbi:hypothetical protein N7468_006901 [Penicillium chermesinum]|uniref:RING-type domain-containing protein n=1 Tax=Penicillium chermesinum TaxID=63820 RepID=A0A9W9NT39_9EURO|nr:uncharacterized protein N7468_006901 [Penicillium chermesinum]KAJ5225676.1 hypothetical protein N7468_006901 [Penicillium chermesinum]